MNKKIIVLSILFIGFATVAAYFLFFSNSKKTPEQQSKTEQKMDIFRIYLPSEDKKTDRQESNPFVIKEIYFQRQANELKNVEIVIESFFNELHAPFKDTKLIGFYRDKDNSVYIDLSREFKTAQNAEAEYYLIKAFYKTVKDNFPWIRDIKILIEGKEVETVAGHVSIYPSLKNLEDN